jgi:hypothetical protein
VGNEKRRACIQRNNLQLQTFNEDIFRCFRSFFGKTIDTILEAASTNGGDGKYLFLTFKKPIESEQRKGTDAIK